MNPKAFLLGRARFVKDEKEAEAHYIAMQRKDGGATRPMFECRQHIDFASAEFPVETQTKKVLERIKRRKSPNVTNTQTPSLHI